MIDTVKSYLRAVNLIRSYIEVVGLTGIFSVIKAKILNTTDLFEVNKHDVKAPLNLRLPSSDVSTYEQVFINQEYDFLVETQPNVIVDAGANIGLASIYFANKYPEAKIIAIEPEESNFKLLKQNVAPYSTIFPVQAALWNENGEINLVDPGRGNWGFVTETADELLGNVCHKIATITMEKIIDDYELDKIDILKIDIEGAEKEVFSKTSSWIKKVDALIVEIHEYMKPGCSRSFYNGSNGFDNEWHQGENVYLSRGKCLIRQDT